MEVVGISRLSESVLLDNILVVTAVIIAVGTVGTMFWKGVRPLVKRVNAFLDWQDQFRPQWEGMHSANPGDVEVPGVMERLSRIDGEFMRNGGNSMKDTLVRLTREVESIARGLEELREDVKELGENMRRVHDDNRSDAT